MPRIEPFKGILYNPKKVDVSKVVAPPYDVISVQMQDELYRANEYNIVRLILGKDEPADSRYNNKYTRAKKYFDKWLTNKILIQDETEAAYIYGQEYLYGDKKKTRIGFIARMKIEDPRTSRVLPHEYTFAKPKEDRLKLIKETKANLCPIFSLFQDKDNKINSILKGIIKERPVFDIELEGIRHKFWRLTNKAPIKKIQWFMRNKDIFIADGHHRYEVAVMYRNEMHKKNPKSEIRNPKLKKPYDYVMMYFSPLNDEGLTILSTHRVIKKIDMDIEEFIRRLKEYFYLKTFNNSKSLFKEMSSAKKGEYTFGMCYKNKQFYLLKLKEGITLDKVIKEDKSQEWKRLDVSILHGLILNNILNLKSRIQDEDNIIYTRDPNYAIGEIAKGSFEVAFFLNPTKVAQVRDIAQKGDKMPHKSTYFYPKLLSGLVINKL